MAEATAKVEKPKASKVGRDVVAKKEPKAPKEDGEEKERARKYPENYKIKVLNKENPHREGSKRAAAFAAVASSKTMKDYYDSGHKLKYIQDWVDSKHIEVG